MPKQTSTSTKLQNLNRHIIVFDFETDGLQLDTVNVIQIGAIAIDLRHLIVDQDSKFNTFVCPPNIDDKDYLTPERKKTYAFHKDNAWKGKSTEAILNTLRKAPSEKKAFKEFTNYCKAYKTGGSYDCTPIAGGYNIEKFDIPILKNILNRSKAGSYPFHYRDSLDMINAIFPWTLFATNPPKNLKLDTIRETFGMATENAHDALQDVIDTAKLSVKFLKLYRELTPHIDIFND